MIEKFIKLVFLELKWYTNLQITYLYNGPPQDNNRGTKLMVKLSHIIRLITHKVTVH